MQIRQYNVRRNIIITMKDVIILEKAKKLGLTGIKKYWKRTGQVEMKLDWLHASILELAIFVKHSQRVYDNKEVGQNMSIKQDIDPE